MSGNHCGQYTIWIYRPYTYCNSVLHVTNEVIMNIHKQLFINSKAWTWYDWLGGTVCTDLTKALTQGNRTLKCWNLWRLLSESHADKVYSRHLFLPTWYRVSETGWWSQTANKLPIINLEKKWTGLKITFLSHIMMLLFNVSEKTFLSKKL